MSGVSVKLYSGISSINTTTAFDGSFRLGGIPAQQYQASFIKDNYVSQTVVTSITENETDSLNIVLKAGATVLKAAQDSIRVNADAGELSLLITSNTAWVASCASSFLQLTPSTTSGSGTLDIKYTADTSLTARTDTIFLTAGSLKIKLPFRQASPIKLLSYFNGPSMVDDSLFVLFNKHIKVVSISPSSGGCQSDNMGFRYINNSNGFKFRYTCATYLANKFPFTIEVTDDDGNTFRQTVTFQSFTISRDLGGTIMNQFFSQDNKSIWVCTQNPNVIYQLSTSDFSILHKFTLSYAPTEVKLNPYNNLLYVLTNSQFIYEVDPVTGQQVKQIAVTYNNYGGIFGQSYPVNYVSDIGFTSFGYGIIIFPVASTTNAWQIIDSGHDDKIYYSPDYVWANTDFLAIYNNFDNSKLLMTGMYGTCQLTVFEGSTQTIQRIMPPSDYITRDVFITPSKKNNNIYFGQLYNQFVMDLQLNTSVQSGIDNRANGSADFCYIPGKTNHIYFSSDDFFQVLNYDNGTTLMSISAPNLRGCMTSTDGKYLIMRNGTLLYQFSTSMFDN